MRYVALQIDWLLGRPLSLLDYDVDRQFGAGYICYLDLFVAPEPSQYLAFGVGIAEESVSFGAYLSLHGGVELPDCLKGWRCRRGNRAYLVRNRQGILRLLYRHEQAAHRLPRIALEPDFQRDARRGPVIVADS